MMKRHRTIPWSGQKTRRLGIRFCALRGPDQNRSKSLILHPARLCAFCLVTAAASTTLPYRPLHPIFSLHVQKMAQFDYGICGQSTKRNPALLY